MSEEKPVLSPEQQSELASLIKEPVRGSEYLVSGAANHVFRLTTGSGSLIAKICKEDIPDLFRMEADGLDILGRTGNVAVPRVLAHSKEFLVMEDLGPEAKVACDEDWYAFGREIGALHLNEQEYFGYHFDNYLGIWKQGNTPSEDWVDFYYTHRVSCYYEAGRNREFITADDIEGIEAVFRKMGDLVPDMSPALCHGDLWMNNAFRKEGGGIILIDPAVHYGHPEADLAMTQMYDLFPDAFYEGYGESRPLIPGWKDRMPLYQFKELLLVIAQFGHEESLIRLREILARYR